MTTQSSGPYLKNAPKEIRFELYDITIRQNRKLSLVAQIFKWTVKFTVDDRTIINYLAVNLITTIAPCKDVKDDFQLVDQIDPKSFFAVDDMKAVKRGYRYVAK